MWIYLYQNNSELAMKNAYIGEVWTPTSNTLLYMPLNWDAKDEVSGNSGTWSGTAQYQTLASWLKVANCNSSSYILTPSITTNAPITISWWLYRVDGNVIFRSDSKNWTRNLWQIAINGRPADTQWAWWWIYYNGTGYLYYSWTNAWWKYIVVTLWSNWVKIYVNWELTYTYNNTSFVWKTQQWWINFDQYSTSLPIPWAWYYSNLIIENRVWTAEQVALYYNNTKSNYWIS